MKKLLNTIGSLISIIISAAVMALPFRLILFLFPDLLSISSYINAIYYLLYITISIVLSAHFDVFLRKKFLKITNEIKNFENGDIYEGEMRNGKMDGKGKYIFKSGEIYTGQFKNNKFHGKGQYKELDGTILSGKWKNDEYYKK